MQKCRWFCVLYWYSKPWLGNRVFFPSATADRRWERPEGEENYVCLLVNGLQGLGENSWGRRVPVRQLESAQVRSQD